MHSLFISYARQDGLEISSFFDDRLSGAGADVFRDKTGLRSGNYKEQLMQAIAERDKMLVLLTPAALQSDWVLEEIETAKTTGTEIIAFRCWHNDALPDVLRYEEAPRIASDKDKLTWVKALDTTLTYLERDGRTPRAATFANQRAFENYDVDGVLILNETPARELNLDQADDVGNEAKRMAELFLKNFSKDVGYVPPSHPGLACCFAACLAGQNRFPDIYWPHKVGKHWVVSGNVAINSYALRDELRAMMNPN